MRKFGLIAALAIASACSSTDGPEPSVTTTVAVSSTPTEIAINETAQASAIVKDQNGSTLKGKAVTWTSLNQNVATVTSAGVIRGVSAGNATIQGSVDGVTGSATVSVFAPPAICADGPTTVDIAPGEVKVLGSRAIKGCVKIASTSAASQYVVVAANTNFQSDHVATYSIKSDEGETVPSNSLLGATAFRVSPQLSMPITDQPGPLQDAFEAGLRRMERRDLNFAAGKRAYQSRVASPGVRMSVSAAIPAVGDKGTFKVPAKFDASGNSLGGSCTNYTSATATVKYVSTRAIIYLDDAAPAGGFTDTDFQEIANEFDNLIYPTDVDYFGTPLDQDNNSRVIMLYTPLVNKLTAANSSGFVGGFFFVGDLFPTTGTNSCAQSNVAEIFYLLAPDPTGSINNNPRSTATVRQGTRGTIAHEFQHMINGSERFRSAVTEDFESTWLDEGLAHFAEDLNGRAKKQLNETGNYTFSQLLPSSADINDFNAFFFQNFARFGLYLANPGPNSPTTQYADTSLADRGAAWALIRSTADQYAPGGDVKAFIRSLVPGPDTGVVNLRSHAGNVSFDSLTAGWLVANYADDAGIPGLPAKYSYKTYNMRDNVARSRQQGSQVYPLIPTTITGSGFALTNLLTRSGSGNYFTFSRPPGGAARSFRFLGVDPSTAASFTGANLIIVRTQ